MLHCPTIQFTDRYKQRENFVFATLGVAHFTFATLNFDICFCPILSHLGAKPKPRQEQKGRKQNKISSFSFWFCSTWSKNDTLPRTGEEKTKYQNLE
jgi:hypothetical protein